jgi:hypothetical protein
MREMGQKIQDPASGLWNMKPITIGTKYTLTNLEKSNEIGIETKYPKRRRRL